MSLISYFTLQSPLFSSEISLDLYLLVAVVFANIVLAFLLARRANGPELTEPKPTTSVAQKAEEVTGKLFCINCGAELPPQSKFCSSCGTSQT